MRKPFFPGGRFNFGAAYYPEHWNDEDKKNDIKLMKEASFNMVRLAEFAWCLMEKHEGLYDFSFFDAEIDKLGKNGINTMLCTPTAAPPRWMTFKHPEILRVDADGKAMLHGSRQHACHSNKLFRDYSRKITRKMAEHFSSNPYVTAWQTDNEINCHFQECHCASCQEAFREFLKLKYQTIDELNKCWGTIFWGQTYSSFEEIDTPKKSRPTYLNPSHQLDYFRFIAWSVAVFQKEQVDILREVRNDWFITHNGVMNLVDYHGSFSADLNILGYDVYPMFCYEEETRPFKQSFNLDRVRSYSGNFIIPEHQSGPGGQAPYFHDNPRPGEIRNMTMTSIARGADSLLYFRWRTCRFGAEQYWCGIIDHDNIPRRRYEEVKSIGTEIMELEKSLEGTEVFSDCAVPAFDFDVRYAHEAYSLGLPAPEWIAEEIHITLSKRGFSCSCLHPDELLDSGVKLYILPHWTIVRPEWAVVFEEFVKRGGTLLVGARSGTRDINNNIVSMPLPGLLGELCSVTVTEYGKLNEKASFSADGALPLDWYETLELGKDARALMNWYGGYLDGLPALSIKTLGKGRVLYAASYLKGDFLKAVLKHMLPLLELSSYSEFADPETVDFVRRVGKNHEIQFFINRTDKIQKLNAVKEASELPPFGVLTRKLSF